jgi:hypothetical protein
MALIIILILITQAASDALFFTGNKELSKLIECVGIALFFVLMKGNCGRTWSTVFAFGLFYVFMRLLCYDMVFNLIAGLDINFVGSTSYIYDFLMSKLSYWAFWVFRAFYLAVALIIYLKILKYEKIS